jgi:hypothetical protein
MKKVFFSLGVAAGAAGLCSAYGQGMQAATPKLWNVNATLRGFYDDNYTVGNSKKGSFGWEFSPTISGNVDMQQTDFGARYTFGMYYYVKRADEGLTPLDYTHQADVWLDHAFSETLKVTASDSLAIAQDPELVQGGSLIRVQGNNVANHALLTLSKEWTRQFSTATHYNNDVYIYSDNGGGTNNVTGSNPSNAALLNRMEQSIGTDFQWQFQPETMGLIGYAFSFVRYTGDQQISGPPPGWVGPIKPYYSDARDYNAHYVYIGAQHSFSPNFSGTGKVGASYVDSYNDPYNPSKSWAPYADISTSYAYQPGCYIQGGFRQDISATSEVAPASNGELTQYQETSVFYFDITHRIAPKLTGTLISQYTYSSFKSGAYSGQPENSVNVGVNLSYQINRHFSADAGYNFDEYFSDVAGRDSSRNRVYLGLSASY